MFLLGGGDGKYAILLTIFIYFEVMSTEMDDGEVWQWQLGCIRETKEGAGNVTIN